MLIKNRLRIIDEKIEVQEENQEEINRIVLDEEAMQVTVSKEVIAATDTSVKESKMEICWRIEDIYEYVPSCNVI